MDMARLPYETTPPLACPRVDRGKHVSFVSFVDWASVPRVVPCLPRCGDPAGSRPGDRRAATGARRGEEAPS
eukprot:914721-Prymnesium_polylepis.1